MLHLDLLVLSAFSVSLACFNAAQIAWSVPLVYPPLLYLLGRMLWIGLRRRDVEAQFGMPLPYPEQAIDTLLAHSRDTGFFRADEGNACNVLDVIHPLWLCFRQTDYRRDEGKAWARKQLDRALNGWQEHVGSRSGS